MSLALLVVFVVGQKRPPAKVAAPVPPVTCAEARDFLQRVEGAIADVNGAKNPPDSIIRNSNAPVTREAILLEYKRIFDFTRPFFSYEPNPAIYNPAMFHLKGAAAMRAAKSLAGWGCINRVGALVTNQEDTISPAQFGDESGLFLSRLAELTHTPTIKFSPYLEH